jgi:hypothetical protein
MHASGRIGLLYLSFFLPKADSITINNTNIAVNEKEFALYYILLGSRNLHLTVETTFYSKYLLCYNTKKIVIRKTLAVIFVYVLALLNLRKRSNCKNFY